MDEISILHKKKFSTKSVTLNHSYNCNHNNYRSINYRNYEKTPTFLYKALRMYEKKILMTNRKYAIHHSQNLILKDTKNILKV